MQGDTKPVLIPTVGNIVRCYLHAHGFAGLFHPDGDCACKLDDLWPCGYPNGDCRAGVFVECPGEGCEGYRVDGHYHIGQSAGTGSCMYYPDAG